MRTVLVVGSFNESAPHNAIPRMEAAPVSPYRERDMSQPSRSDFLKANRYDTDKTGGPPERL
jgi:hypothetical protein